MRMTLFYVADTNPAKDWASYIEGPFNSYHAAVDAKNSSNLISDYLEVVEHNIEVEL